MKKVSLAGFGAAPQERTESAMLRFATIGSGWITDEYIHGAKDSGLWELTAVYSRDRARGEAYAQKHGAKLVFTDVEELARCKEVDAVYIASPNAAHYEQCRVLLEAGKHVKEEGKENNLLELIAADPAFHLTLEELEGSMEPSRYVGRAPIQVEKFLAQAVQPVLEEHKDMLGLTAEINV